MTRIRSHRLIGALFVGAALLSACAPISRYQGYTVTDASPTDAKIGQDDMNTVRTKYGSPTQVATFEPIWFYMAQTTDQFGAYLPRLRQRDIVTIRFDKQTQKVAEVKRYNAADGRIISYSDRETPTTGRELSVIEQLLGNVGQRMLPRDEADPGNVGGQR